MATEPPSVKANGMIARIKAILLTPKTEWAVIDGEPASTAGIMTGWVLPLAAIGPVAGLIGNLAFFNSSAIAIFRPSPSFLVASAVAQYVLAVVGVYVLSLIVNALAPSFGGQKNPVQALKAVAYSWTAGFVAGIFAILPQLSFLWDPLESTCRHASLSIL